MEKLFKIDLCASGCERIKIKIVNVYIAVSVGFGMFRVENIHSVVFLSRNRTVFQHCTHSGIAVDIGIFTFDIAVLGVAERKLVENAHKIGFHLS